MLVQLFIHIRFVAVARMSWEKLLLNSLHSVLILFHRKLVIRLHFSYGHVDCLLQNLVKERLLGQLNIKVDISFPVLLVDFLQSLVPHVEIVLCVFLTVGILYFSEFAILKLTFHPLHFLRAQQDAIPFKLSSKELANIFIAVAEIFLAKCL